MPMLPNDERWGRLLMGVDDGKSSAKRNDYPPISPQLVFMLRAIMICESIESARKGAKTQSPESRWKPSRLCAFA
ncbi:MAG: hypothetical protein ACOYMN_19650 [Roseimicrobium sp.]